MSKSSAATNWEQMYFATSLSDTAARFCAWTSAPFLAVYLEKVRSLCADGGRTLETGFGSGYGAIQLSLDGYRAEGMDNSPRIVERARQVNALLGGDARFWVGDLFDLDGAVRQQHYFLIHHQGVLEHFTVPQVRLALAQQVALADHVVFSAPSVHYPFAPEFGEERLLAMDRRRAAMGPAGPHWADAGKRA